MSEPIERWRDTFRRGIAPQLSLPALEALRRAICNDDPRLIQGATVSPPPIEAVQHWQCEGCCGMCYGPWQADHLETVAEVCEVFPRLCQGCDERMGEYAAVRWFLNFFDEMPRAEMRAALLPEVELAIAGRAA